MPIIKSAIKRAKQTEKRRERNISTKKSFRGAIKSFLEKPSTKGLQEAQSEIDTAVKKKVLAKNTASRKKARLARIAKDAGVKPAQAAEKKATTAKKPATKAPAKPAAPKKPAAKPSATTTTAKKAPAKKPAAKK